MTWRACHFLSRLGADRWARAALAALLIVYQPIAAYAQVGPLAGYAPSPFLWSSPANITFQTSNSNSSSAATYTYTAQAVGAAAAGRIVFVGVTGYETTTQTISVTLNGAPMTQLISSEGSNGSVFIRSALYALALSSGTTADVVVTYSTLALGNSIGVWSGTGLLSSTPTATATSTATPLSASLNIAAGGAAIAVGGFYYNAGAITAVNWAGLTGRYTNIQATSQLAFSGANLNFVAAQTGLSITATQVGGSTYQVSSGVFAAFR